MKNARIRFDDRFYLTTLFLLFTIASLVTFAFFVEKLSFDESAFFIALFSLFLAGFFMAPKMGIYFNYKTRTIKYFGQHKTIQSVFKMNDVEKIIFSELKATRKKGISPPGSIIYTAYSRLESVYRNGKMYAFYIFLKNGDVVEIPYLNLFKASSKKRVEKQEIRIKKVLENFNQFCSCSK